MKRCIEILVVCIALLCFGCSDNEQGSALKYESIDALINECKLELDKAVEGDGIGQYVKGSKSIFSYAINDAEHVRANADRQSALDNFVVKLGVARTVFQNSKVAMACPYFNGTSFIDCGAASQLIGTKYTLEIWVKMSSSSAQGAGIIGAEGTDGNTWDGFILRRAEGVDKALDFCVVNGTWSSCLSPANSFEFERWTHVACTFDGRNAKVYFDGVEVSSMVISEYPTVCWGNLIIGDLAFFRGRYYVGNLYDLRIWNTVRTPEQIQDNMNNLLKGDEEGLVASWPLNVKGGTSISDITGKHNATLHNITWADLDRVVE